MVRDQFACYYIIPLSHKPNYPTITTKSGYPESDTVVMAGEDAFQDDPDAAVIAGEVYAWGLRVHHLECTSIGENWRGRKK